MEKWDAIDICELSVDLIETDVRLKLCPFGWHIIPDDTRKGITIELTGKNKAPPSSGKDALGARVQVTAGGITQTRQVVPGMGHARRLHFGLGSATNGVSIKIYWPDNPSPQIMSGDAYLNTILRVSQP